MIASSARWGIAIFPAIAFLIAFWFAVQLGNRFVRGRRRPHEGVWAIALLMYAVASLAMFFGVLDRWSPSEFRTYWVLGAVLNVPFLFLGEVYLLARRRVVGHVLLALLLVASAFAAWKVATASIDGRPLGRALPLGKDVFGDGSTAYRLAQFYSLPAYFLLLGGLMWSAASMRGNAALRDRTFGILGIAAGATIVAIGSGIGAAFHVVPLFSVSLAAGIAVMYWGFVRSSRPPARSTSPATAAATTR